MSKKSLRYDNNKNELLRSELIKKTRPGGLVMQDQFVWFLSQNLDNFRL